MVLLGVRKRREKSAMSGVQATNNPGRQRKAPYDGMRRLGYCGNKSGNTAKNNPESEGVLMIVLHDVIFGCIGTIVFQLTGWIVLFEKSAKTAIVSAEQNRGMYGLAYPSLRGRHDECIKPHPFRKNPFGIYHKTAKLLFSSGAAKIKIFQNKKTGA